MNHSHHQRAHQVLSVTRKAGRRRGIAMMLVLGMLAAVTVLTAAAISSQQNAPEAGVNATSEVQARWSAESAASLAVAVLETNFDYSGTNAEMMAKQLLANGLADVRITTVDGRVPTTDDLELLLISSATVNGVAKEVRKRITLVPAVPLDEALDPLLREFAVVAARSLSLEDSARVGQWGLSPAAGTKPVSVGAFGSLSSNVSLGASPSLSRVALFTDVSADAALATRTGSSDLASGGRPIPYDVPPVPELVPAPFAGLPVAAPADIVLSGGSTDVTLPTGGKYADLRVLAGATVRLNSANGTHYSFESLVLDDSAVLVVQGPLLIETRTAFAVSNRSAVALGDAGSALAVFTKGDVLVSDSGVGVPPSVARDSARTPASLTGYINPARLRLCTQPATVGGAASPQVRFSNGSMLVGCIVAPNADLAMRHGSMIFGRVTAHDLAVREGSAIFYDPALDKGTGYTSDKSVLFASGGTAVPEITTVLSSFTPESGAAALTTTIQSVGTLVATEEDEMGPPPVLGTALTSRDTRIVKATPVEDLKAAGN